MTDKDRLIDAIFRHGVLIDLHMSCWQAKAKLEPEVLGIKAPSPKLITLGSKRLLSKRIADKPKNIISASRFYLNNRSHGFPLSRARFVPQDHLRVVVDKLEEYEVRFLEAVEAIQDEYEAEKQRMLEQEWRPALEQSLGDVEAINTAMDTVASSYPNQKDLRRRYAYYWTLFHIAMPDGISTQITNIKTEEAMERNLNDFIQGCVRDLQGKVEELASQVKGLVEDQGDIIAFSKSSRESIQSKIDTIKVLNFFNNAVVEQTIEVIKSEVDSPLSSRTSIRNAADAVLESIGAGMSDAVQNAVDALTGSGKRSIEI